MDLDRIIAIARERMGEQPRPARETGYLFHHGLRTGQLATQLAKAIDEDAGAADDVLFVAGLFHDVGKAHDPHHETGAKMAQELLAHECTPAELDQICEIIRAHCQRARPNHHSFAARIVQDADLLDHFGTQGVWLAIHDCPDAPPHEVLEHYREWRNANSVAAWREALSFDAGQRIFDQRITFEQKFFDHLDCECDGELS